MRSEIIVDAGRLKGCAAAWWDLFERVPAASPFLSPAWLLPWWHNFAPGTLMTVAVWEGEQLVGLAPLYREDGRLGRRLLPLGIGISDYLDILLDPEQATDAGMLLTRALKDHGDGWDLWSAEDAATDASVLALACPDGWTEAVGVHHACPVLALPAESTAWRSAVPAGTLRKWRMAQHRAARRDTAMVDAEPDSIGTRITDLIRLHGARWQARGEAGVLDNPAVRRFHGEAAPALARAGLLTLSSLHIDGVVAGVYYGLRRGGRAYAYLQGFDPAFSFESPGTLLVGSAIARAAAEGAREFHFLRGQEDYKYRWGAVDRWTSHRTLRPRQ